MVEQPTPSTLLSIPPSTYTPLLFVQNDTIGALPIYQRCCCLQHGKLIIFFIWPIRVFPDESIPVLILPLPFSHRPPRTSPWLLLVSPPSVLLPTSPWNPSMPTWPPMVSMPQPTPGTTRRTSPPLTTLRKAPFLFSLSLALVHY